MMSDDDNMSLPLSRVPSKISLGDRSLLSENEWRPRSSLYPKKRELVAWLIIVIQAIALLTATSTMGLTSQSKHVHNHQYTGNPLSINNRPPQYHEEQFLKATSSTGGSTKTPFYDPPTFYPPSSGLVSRVWHSNGSPDINDGLQSGSCWCSGDDFCMCTPSLAVDVLLTSGQDHVWMVERADSGKMALMGGFAEVGETVEEAAQRELEEEMNISLPEQDLTLFGVYSDPKRDARKHATSVVFAMEIPPNVIPTPGDDALKVHRYSWDEVFSLVTFADHKTVLRDYRTMRQRKQEEGAQQHGLPPFPQTDDEEPFKRSICNQ